MTNETMQVRNDLVHKQCPLCKSDEIYKKGELGYSGQTLFSSQLIKLIFVPELWCCKQCDSSFVQNSLTADTAYKLYTIGQADERWSTVPFELTKTFEVISYLKSIFTQKGKILDIGCNTGALLDFARSAGCETTGVEFSESSQRILKQKGHRAYSKFNDVTGISHVITAFDLVEHLYDIQTFLKSCSEKLDDQGRLIILTGEVESQSAKFAGLNWWYMQYPEHIIFPSRKFFREFSGFKIESWISTYASTGYQSSPLKKVLAVIKAVLKGKYNGLPSVGPDHVLVTLKK